MRLPPWILAPVLALLAACAADPPGPAPAPSTWNQTDLFEAGSTLLSGLEISGQGPLWLPGDSVLLGIAVERPGGTEVRFLRSTLRALDPSSNFEVTNTFPGEPEIRLACATLQVTMECFDQQGHLLASAPGRVPLLLTEAGLFDLADYVARGAAAGADGGRPADDTEHQAFRRRAVIGVASLFSFTGGLGDNSLLKSLIEQVIDRPSLFSMLFGVRFNVSLPNDEMPVRSEYPFAPDLTIGTYRLPLIVKVNDTTALNCQVVAAPVTRPLGLCSGVVAVEATKPSDPRTRLHIRLLAATRARPPAE